MSGNRGIVKRLFIGRALASNRLGDTLLSLLPFRSKQIITAIAKDGGSLARAFPPAG